jgi:DNA-binding IclR family transcriptional regulator
MKACPRFCYYGHGLFLPQKNEVQSDANQNAGEHSSGKLRKNNQQGRNTGQSEDNSQHRQYLAAIAALIHVKHGYTSSSVRF